MIIKLLISMPLAILICLSANQANYTIYFASELFDQKHLTGNFFLAKKIEDLSHKKYRCILPQDMESIIRESIKIRNTDLDNLARADLALFNFDGPDLDSGTVVEFIIAKMLDIPCIIIRSDLRKGGDQEITQDPWNLMCSGYPRSIKIEYNAIDMYKTHGMEAMHTNLAQLVLEAIEEVAKQPTIFVTKNELLTAYHLVIKACSAHLEDLLPETAVEQIIAEKISKGIYQLH